MSENITLKTVVSDCLTAQGTDLLKDTPRFVSIVKDYSMGSLQNQDYLMKILGDDKFLSYYLNVSDDEDALVLAYKNSYDYLVDHYPFNEMWMKQICSEVHDAFLEYIQQSKSTTKGSTDMDTGNSEGNEIVEEEKLESNDPSLGRSSPLVSLRNGAQSIVVKRIHVFSLGLAGLLVLILMVTFIGKYGHLQSSVNKLGINQDETIYSEYAVVMVSDSSTEDVKLYSDYDNDQFKVNYPSRFKVTFTKSNKIQIEKKRSGIGLIKCTSKESNGFFYILVIGVNDW